MRTVQTIIPSSQGNLAAAVHYPVVPTDRLAVLCPGYLDSKDYRHLVGLADVLSERGYVVVRFDPTGTWESDGDIATYTTTQYLEDIKRVLEYMQAEKQYTYILLGGHSRGGMVSLLYAARDPSISIVLGIMPSSGRSLVGKRREEWRATGFRISTRDLPEFPTEKRVFRVPYTHVEDRDQYDVVTAVTAITVPIILLAGGADEVVLPQDVEEIFQHANEPKAFTVIPSIGHDYRHSDEQVRLVNELILDQLSKA